MNGLMSKVLSFTMHRSQQQAQPVAESEVLESRPLPMVGLFALLDDGQKEKSLRFEENEQFGPDEFRRKKA